MTEELRSLQVRRWGVMCATLADKMKPLAVVGEGIRKNQAAGELVGTRIGGRLNAGAVRCA
jgi:hypothetical protein